MATRVERGARIRHVVDVAPWLLAHNDDAPAPGRVLVHAGCAGCGRVARMALWAGTWAVEHDHGADWTAHLLTLAPGPGPAPAGRTITLAPDLEAAALAAGLVDAFTR